MNPRFFYNLGYRLARMPWEIGPRQELVELVRSGRHKPGPRDAAYLMARR